MTENKFVPRKSCVTERQLRRRALINVEQHFLNLEALHCTEPVVYDSYVAQAIHNTSPISRESDRDTNTKASFTSSNEDILMKTNSDSNAITTNNSSNDDFFVETDCDSNLRHNSSDNDNLTETDSDSNSCNVSNNDASIENSDKFSDFLQCWANKYKISHVAISSLLRYLRVKFPAENLPSDARMLLKSPKVYKDYKLNSNRHKYTYFTIESALRYYISLDFKPPIQNEVCFISLRFNVDGIPIHKNKQTNLWPILCSPRDTEYTPQMIALCTTNNASKPDDVDAYLCDFVAEAETLNRDGFLLNNITYKLDLKNSFFSCDAPAKAFIKCMKGHTAKAGCDYCSQEGTFTETHVTFEPTCKRLRTDISFRQKLDEDHHHKTNTPLLRLSMDLINGFPIDYMHAALLGISKKLLRMWLNGPLNFRIPLIEQGKISDYIVLFNKHLPSVFNRRVQAVAHYTKWKATEHRTFVLYIAPFILRHFVKNDIYRHFMLFFTALYVMCSKRYYLSHLTFAAKLLQKFVTDAETIYGTTFLSYNVHILLHLPNFVSMYGPVDDFSCFSFETYLGYLKSLKRSGKHSHQQICRRYHESRGNVNATRIKVNIKEMAIITMDNNFQIENALLVTDFDENNETYFVEGQSFKNIADVWSYPCSSSKLGIFKAIINSTKIKLQIKKKSASLAIAVPLENDHYIVAPLVNKS